MRTEKIDLLFPDRSVAGRKLAEKVQGDMSNAVVVALPRGGVVTGFEIAKILKAPLEILTVRKIGHPTNPEYAIGAVDPQGATILNEEELKYVDREWLIQEIKNKTKEASGRATKYAYGRLPLELRGRTVIIADDGIATGYTMRLAVQVVKAQQPKKIVVAVPVASEESLAQLYKDGGVDEIVVLVSPSEFQGAVGSHYRKFDQVRDEEVIELLKTAESAFPKDSSLL